TNGEYVSSHLIHHILQFEGIDQFQFIEEENNHYIIKLKVNSHFDFSNESKLIAKYREYFGPEADIVVDYVNDIPLMLSGKRKLVINNAIKSYNFIGKITDKPIINGLRNFENYSI